LADELQEVAVPIVSREECTAAYGEGLSRNTLCAGLAEGGKDSCQGDSGGPLLAPTSANASGWKVAGIVSWGNGCARKGYYGVYTRVINYTAWIAEQISVEGSDEPTATVTPVSTATPTVPRAIQNGDFEAGNSGGWREKSAQGYPLIAASLPVPPLNGRYAVWLGGANEEISRIFQQITAPSTAELYLIFAYQIQSEEEKCTQDRAKLFFNDQRLLTLALCHSASTASWRTVALDLAAYRNRSGVIQFYTATDRQRPSSWLVDQVYLATTLDGQTVDQVIVPDRVTDSDAAENSNTQAEIPGLEGGAILPRVYLPHVER
jgi:hypothetical protein